MLGVPATGLAAGPLAGDEGNTGLDFVADPEDEPDRACEEIRESLRPINSARISTALLRSCIVRTKHERRARHDTSIDPGATADGPAVSGASPDRRAARGAGPSDRGHACLARRDL